MNFSKTTQQIELQEKIISFAKTHLNQGLEQRDKDQIFDRKLWEKLGEMRIPGLCIPEKYGGLGNDALTTVLALEALGEGCEDGGLCFAVAAHMLSCCIPILHYGTESQKQEYLPKLCDGTFIAGNAMTEQNAGSDAFNLSTVANRLNEQYLLNGHKTFITNGPVADLLVTYANTNKEKGFFGGITSFLLDKRNNAFVVSSAMDKFGVRTCLAGEAEFDELILDTNSVLGKEGGGSIIFNESMSWERTCLGAIHLGAMQRELDKVVQFTRKRVSGNQSIREYQAVSHVIAELKANLETVRTLTYRTSWKLSIGEDVGMDASITKLQVSETFKEFAVKVFQLYGGQAYKNNHSIGRVLQDAMGSTLYSGTSEIQKNIIAKRMGV